MRKHLLLYVSTITHFSECYYLCQVIEYQEGLEITKKEAKEYLGMEFET